MKRLLLITFLAGFVSVNAQSVMQTVNSGSVIGAGGSVSVGEIIIVPQNQNQSSSGIIGILAQVNQQFLEVPELELTQGIKVYPNPTMAKIFFESKESLSTQKISIFNTAGQLVLQKQVAADNSVDMTDLNAGIYLIQLDGKKQNSFKIIKH
ncbi:T9SS type A sorting domain-containing protein [Flavobacterium sp. 3HN19-14]|uniref:T9SS type A sorting domain-containing protein n=1 Tax=Flavobacterium sp. 3HN19-14 TaxID=3448133 RepID=UPI003EE30AEF